MFLLLLQPRTKCTVGKERKGKERTDLLIRNREVGGPTDPPNRHIIVSWIHSEVEFSWRTKQTIIYVQYLLLHTHKQGNKKLEPKKMRAVRERQQPLMMMMMMMIMVSE